MKKVFKGLIAISDVLDDRYEKLSDKYYELELSHNRKKKALSKILSIIDNDCPGYNPNPLLWCDLVNRIRHFCNDALFSDGRVNCPCINHKVKGEKR